MSKFPTSVTSTNSTKLDELLTQLDSFLSEVSGLTVESWNAILEADRTFEFTDVAEEDIVSKFPVQSLKEIGNLLKSINLECPRPAPRKSKRKSRSKSRSKSKKKKKSSKESSITTANDNSDVSMKIAISETSENGEVTSRPKIFNIWDDYMLNVCDGVLNRVQTLICISAYFIGQNSEWEIQIEAIRNFLLLFRLPYSGSQKTTLLREGIFRNILKSIQSASLNYRIQVLTSFRDFLSVFSIGSDVDNVRYVIENLQCLLTTPFEAEPPSDSDINMDLVEPNRKIQLITGCEVESIATVIYDIFERLIANGTSKTRPQIVSLVFKILVPIVLMTYQDPVPQTLSKATHHKARLIAQEFVFNIVVIKYPALREPLVPLKSDGDSDEEQDNDSVNENEAAESDNVEKNAEFDDEAKAQQQESQQDSLEDQIPGIGGKPPSKQVEMIAGIEVDPDSHAQHFAKRKRKLNKDNNIPVTLVSTYFGFIQNLIIVCPDRGDFRASVCESVLRLLRKPTMKVDQPFVMNVRAGTMMFPFLEKLLHCELPSARVLGIEVLSVLIEAICLEIPATALEVSLSKKSEKDDVPDNFNNNIAWRSSNKEQFELANSDNLNLIDPKIYAEKKDLDDKQNVIAQLNQLNQAVMEPPKSFEQYGKEINSDAYLVNDKSVAGWLDTEIDYLRELEELENECWRLIQKISKRCRDVVPSVRSRALSSLNSALMAHHRFRCWGRNYMNSDSSYRNMIAINMIESISLPFKNGINDAKPLVRKAALEYLDGLLPPLVKMMHEARAYELHRPIDFSITPVTRIRLLSSRSQIQCDGDELDSSDIEILLPSPLAFQFQSATFQEQQQQQQVKDSDDHASSKGNDKEIVVFQIELIIAATADESVVVRKKALQTLSLLLQICSNCSIVRHGWTKALLPSIVDVEPSIAEKAMDEIEKTVFDVIVSWKDKHSDIVKNTDSDTVTGFDFKKFKEDRTFLLLEEMETESIEYLTRAASYYLKNKPNEAEQLMHALLWIFTIWFSDQKSSKNLESDNTTDPGPNRDGDTNMNMDRDLDAPVQPPVVLFNLFDEISGEFVKRSASIDSKKSDQVRQNMGLLMNVWNGCITAQNGNLAAVQKVIRILGNHCAFLDQRSKAEILDVLEFGVLEQCEVFQTPLLRSALHTIRKLSYCDDSISQNSRNPKQRLNQWRPLLRRVSETCSDLSILQKNFTGLNHVLKRQLFILGELALIDSDIVTNSTITSLQAICTNNCFRGSMRIFIPDALRSHAFIVFGKLCLRREQLAKRSIEMLIHFLTVQGESLQVRNNILIIVGDLAMVYTSLIDRFIPLITDFLGHESVLLRKTALLVLSSLLAEDFIKFKGNIIHRLLFLIADESQEISDFVEAIFLRILHPRNNSLFQQHFVETLCSLNGWTGHPNFPAVRDDRKFHLRDDSERRRSIYLFMLRKMTREQKFQVANNLVRQLLFQDIDTCLVQQFLSGYTDAFGFGDENYIHQIPPKHEPGGKALIDCLQILSGKELKVCFDNRFGGHGGGGGNSNGMEIGENLKAASDPLADEAGNGAAGLGRGVGGGLIKRNMIENFVPVFASLKEKMRSQRSPLMGDLNSCLCSIMADFLEDIQQIDPQLAQEIRFDIEQEKLTQQKQAAQIASQNALLGIGGTRNNHHHHQNPMEMSTILRARTHVDNLNEGDHDKFNNDLNLVNQLNNYNRQAGNLSPASVMKPVRMMDWTGLGGNANGSDSFDQNASLLNESLTAADKVFFSAIKPQVALNQQQFPIAQAQSLVPPPPVPPPAPPSAPVASNMGPPAMPPPSKKNKSSTGAGIGIRESIRHLNSSTSGGSAMKRQRLSSSIVEEAPG